MELYSKVPLLCVIILATAPYLLYTLTPDDIDDKSLDTCYVYRRNRETDAGTQEILAITQVFTRANDGIGRAKDACNKPKEVFWLDKDDFINMTMTRKDALDVCFLHKEKGANRNQDIFMSTAFYVADPDDDEDTIKDACNNKEVKIMDASLKRGKRWFFGLVKTGISLFKSIRRAVRRRRRGRWWG